MHAWLDGELFEKDVWQNIAWVDQFWSILVATLKCQTLAASTGGTFHICPSKLAAIVVGVSPKAMPKKSTQTNLSLVSKLEFYL